MELQMAPQVPKSIGRTTPPHHHGSGGGARPVPGYLRPSTGSCHHVCKYGGTHEFEEKEPTKTTKKKPHPKPRKQQAPAAPAESQSKVMVKVRSVFRRRVGDSSKADKVTSAGKAKGGGESVEWKDIVAYDTTDKISAPVAGSGEAKKKKDVDKGNNNSHDGKSTITGQADGEQTQTLDTKADHTAEVIKSAIKPPKGKKKKKKPTSLLVEEMAAMDHQELLQGYQALSPSLMQSRASLLRDLEEEMAVHGGAASTEEEKAEPKPACCLNKEEYAAVAAETTRPIPAHRRVKSLSIGGSRSLRYTIARQASKNNAGGVAFKLRSRSTRAPEVEEKPAMARVRSRRGGEDASSGSTGRGIQLRIRSLRRRGLGGGGSSGGGFVVPAVALRHQKTLEKKSQRLYNNVIEETASKLVKTRKSRVKALVGAFESVISKIAK